MLKSGNDIQRKYFTIVSIDLLIYFVQKQPAEKFRTYRNE
jgi:hypothetical protein